MKLLLLFIWIVMNHKNRFMFERRHKRQNPIPYQLDRYHEDSMPEPSDPDNYMVRVVKMRDEQMDRMNEKNRIPDKHFKSSPQGRDKSDKALLSGQIYMRIKYKQLDENERDDLEQYPFIINNDYVYFFDSDDNYRQVQNGIELLKIVSKSDDCENGKCCTRIQQIKHLKISPYDFEGYCFTLDMPQKDYLFCQDQWEVVEQFRDKLIVQSMMSWFRFMGIDNPPFMDESLSSCQNPVFDWTKTSQESWPCECNKGIAQSPINLDDDIAILKPDDRFKFKFNRVTSIRYGVVRQEPEFYGDFGTFSHISSDQITKYEIEKIVFKVVKPEHAYMQSETMSSVVGELLLYGNSKDMDQSILSIFIETGQDDGRDNEFMHDMNIDSWDYEDVFNEVNDDGQPILKCLRFIEKDKKSDKNRTKDNNDNDNDNDKGIIDYHYPNLRDLIESSNDLTEKYSFFFYTGSDSKPPCQEGIMRYVMKYPAKMESQYYEKLKNKVITETKLKTDSNSREMQQRYQRKVFVHNADHCSSEKEPEPDEPDIDYKFIKAIQKYRTYAIANQHFPIKEIFKIHSEDGNKNLIKVNRNLELTDMKQQPFMNEAGDQIMETLKDKWIKKYGPFVGNTEEEEKTLQQMMKEAGYNKDNTQQQTKTRLKKYRVID